MKETNLDLDDRTLTLDTPASIDAFCEKYTTYVLKALYGITRKRPISKEISERPGLFEELAKDATTDALVWAINNAHKYDPQRAAVRTWLVAGARNRLKRKMANEAKRLHQQQRLEDGLLVAEPIVRPERSLEDQERADEIERVLARLRGKQAEALVWSYYYGYSMEEVAAALDLPTADAASSLVRRARASFERISRAERIPF